MSGLDDGTDDLVGYERYRVKNVTPVVFLDTFENSTKKEDGRTLNIEGFATRKLECV